MVSKHNFQKIEMVVHYFKADSNLQKIYHSFFRHTHTHTHTKRKLDTLPFSMDRVIQPLQGDSLLLTFPVPHLKRSRFTLLLQVFGSTGTLTE